MLPRQKAFISREQPFSHVVKKLMNEFDENEKTLGGFLDEDNAVWRAQGPKLIVVDIRSGEKIAHYQFGAGLNIDCATPCRVAGDYPALLVGVWTGLRSLVCCFDILANRLLSAVAVSFRVLSICVVVDGGQSMASNRLHTELKKWTSLVAVGTVGGRVFLCDTNLQARNAISNETSPLMKSVYGTDDSFGGSDCLLDITEFLFRSSNVLYWADGGRLEAATTAVTTLYYAKEASLLAIGYSFGGVMLYSLELLESLYESLFEHNAAAVMKFALVEPDDDPKPTLYLWALRDKNTCDVEGVIAGREDAPSLEMYQLNFRERGQLSVSENYYSDLMICASRMYWVPDACSTLLDCATLASWPESGKATASNRRISSSRIFMYFVWIHKSGMLMGCLFDINSWYHAQMPQDVLALPEYRVCPFVAWHYLGYRVDSSSPLLICAPIQYSAVRFRQTPDTQFNYFACSYSLSVTVVAEACVKRLEVPDVQSLVLDDVGHRLAEALPEPKDFVLSMQATRLAPVYASDSTMEEMRRHIWTIMLENGRFHYLTKCFSPVAFGSGLFEEFVEWAWWQAVVSKGRFDEICGSLFEGPTVGISAVMKRTLEKEASNLSLLFQLHSFCRLRFQEDSSAACSKIGMRETALRETCSYAKIILWFVDAGVLPEDTDYYPFRAISENHRNAAKALHDHERKLFIDNLAHELNEDLKKTPIDGLPTVTYPLPTFRDALSVYLMSEAEPITKHSIVYYTLLDIENAAAVEGKGVADRFAKEMLLMVDPMLPIFVMIIWHLDKGEHKAARTLLVDALATWSYSTRLKDRFAEVTQELSTGPLVSSSLPFSLPLSFETIVGKPLALNRSDLRSARKTIAQRNLLGTRRDRSFNLANDFDRLQESSFEGTPAKRRAAGAIETLSETPTLPKKAKLDHSRAVFSKCSVRNYDAFNDSSEFDETNNIQEALSLLKAPRANQPPVLDMSNFSQAPASILKKRNQDFNGSSYMEKSIRFAVPPSRSPEFSESAVFSVESPPSSSPDPVTTVAPLMGSRFYQSPTDSEIVLNYTRHRWSLAGLPSPSEIAPSPLGLVSDDDEPVENEEVS